LQCY